VAAVRRPTLLRVFLVWAFVLSLVIYSWAGEKFAWLVLHPLLPLILLAWVGVQAVWEARLHWYGRLGILACIAGLFYAGYASWSVNARHRADPRELLVSTQSSEEVARIADEVVAAAERSDRPLTVTVDASEGATFPWAWYFRDLDVGYVELAAAGSAPDSDVLILTQAANDRLAPELAGREGRRFPFRVWWVRDNSTLTPAAWWRWLTKREPWNPTGGMPEWYYRRP
jgi:predicted membrane-bound mannosyltransferase